MPKRDFDPVTGDALGPEENIPSDTPQSGEEHSGSTYWRSKSKGLYKQTGQSSEFMPSHFKGRKLEPTYQKGHGMNYYREDDGK